MPESRRGGTLPRLVEQAVLWRFGQLHLLRTGGRDDLGRPGRGQERAIVDWRDEPARVGAGDDSRRLGRRGRTQRHSRFRFCGIRRARNRALVRR